MPLAPLLAADDSADAWLREAIFSGGIVGQAITGTILLLSIVALALVVEQLLSLRLGLLAPEGLADQASKRLDGGDLPGAAAVCDRQPSALADVIRAGLVEAPVGGGWPAVEKAMEEAADAEAARRLRRLDYLSVIANVAPMLGLLGTVVGMVIAFRQVAATDGAATAAQLASGIYQALVTTVGGLLVAIPTLAAHAALRNRLEDLMGRVVADAERATRPLKRALVARA